MDRMDRTRTAGFAASDRPRSRRGSGSSTRRRARPISGTQPGQEQAIQRHRGQAPAGTRPRQRRKTRPPGPRSRRTSYRTDGKGASRNAGATRVSPTRR